MSAGVPHTARLALVALALAVALGGCGDRAPVDHPAAPGGAAAEGESWWLLDAPGYRLVSGEQTPAELSASTGSLWMLEYSNSTQTVRLVADLAGGLFSQLSAASPELGRATLDGDVEVIVRQHPGRPEEGIAPSVGAEWTDNGVFVSFGGSGLSQDALNDLIARVRRATRAEWEAAAAAVLTDPPVTSPAAGTDP